MTSVGFGRMIFSCQGSPATLEYRPRILEPGARTATADTRGTNRRRRILLLGYGNPAANENKDKGSEADDKKKIEDKRNEMKHI